MRLTLAAERISGLARELRLQRWQRRPAHRQKIVSSGGAEQAAATKHDQLGRCQRNDKVSQASIVKIRPQGFTQVRLRTGSRIFVRLPVALHLFMAFNLTILLLWGLAQIHQWQRGYQWFSRAMPTEFDRVCCVAGWDQHAIEVCLTEQSQRSADPIELDRVLRHTHFLEKIYFEDENENCRLVCESTFHLMMTDNGTLIYQRQHSLHVAFYPLVVCLNTPAVFWLLLRRHRCLPHTCLSCGYDIRASPRRCPELGSPNQLHIREGYSKCSGRPKYLGRPERLDIAGSNKTTTL